jgi:predicted acylesterase/phospholipase RssA
MDESLTYLHKAMIEQGPFDGIMGFSQGACMAAVLAALVSPGPGHWHRSFRSFQLETPNLHPLWPSEPAIPKLKCACPKSAL